MGNAILYESLLSLHSQDKKLKSQALLCQLEKGQEQPCIAMQTCNYFNNLAMCIYIPEEIHCRFGANKSPAALSMQKSKTAPFVFNNYLSKFTYYGQTI